MSDLDTEARSAGKPATARLAKATRKAQVRVRWLTQDLLELRFHLDKVQEEVARLDRAKSKSQGGDGHAR
jgi:hypothetical protein